MTASAVIHVRADQTAIKGKDLHLRTGESYAPKDLVEYVTKAMELQEIKKKSK